MFGSIAATEYPDTHKLCGATAILSKSGESLTLRRVRRIRRAIFAGIKVKKSSMLMLEQAVGLTAKVSEHGAPETGHELPEPSFGAYFF